MSSFVELARKLRPHIETAAQSLPVADALEAVALFPPWRTGMEYTAGQKVQHDGTLYTVLQTHTSQTDWTPTAAHSLFAKVLIPDEEKIYDWEQPDSTNPYKKGAIVRYDGVVYRSLIDGNIWSPAAYPAGWEVVD